MHESSPHTVARQLEALSAELREAQAGIERLATRATDAQWTARPSHGGWSASECVAHLTMTTQAYLPMLRTAAASVPPASARPKRYRMGFGAWLLARMIEPPARMKARTLPAFVPGSAAPKADVLAAFLESQRALLEWIESATDAPLNHMVLTSPFSARMKYNAYGALRIVAAHQRRHLWQAERAVEAAPAS